MESIENNGKSVKSDSRLAEMKRADLRQFILTVSIVFMLGILLLLLAYIIKLLLLPNQATPTNHEQESRVWLPELLHFMALESGIGFITGGIIAITVESFMRNRAEREHEQQMHDISENVFFALFRTAVTDELVTEMYRALFVPKFARENLEIKYTFIPLSGQEDVSLDNKKLILRQTISFRARNVTDQRVTHTIRPQDEVLIKHDEYTNPFKEFLMEIVGSNSQPTNDQRVHLYDADLAAQVKSEGMRYFLNTQRIFVDAHQSVEVFYVLEKVCRFSDMDTWVTSGSAQNLRLIVELSDQQFSHLEFCVDQAHREKLTKVPSSETKAPTSYMWRLDYPILPYQGIMLRWHPKQLPQQVPQPSSVPTGGKSS